MSPRNRYIAIAAGAVLLLVVGAIVALKTHDFDQYKPLISEQVKSATGRDLVVAGNLELGIGFNTMLSVENVALQNAAWGSRPNMLTVKRLEAEVALIPLLFGNVRIGRLILVEPDLLLETDAEGGGNWVFAPAASTPEATEQGEAAALPGINRVHIQQARIAYRDGKSGEEHQLSLAMLQAEAASLAEPLKLSIEGDYDHQSFRVGGEIESVRKLIDEKPVALDLQAELGALKTGLQGQGTIAASGYALQELVLVLNENRLTGDLRYDLGGERPLLKGDLAFDVLDLRTLAGKPTSEAPKQPAKGARLFPAQEINLQGLRAVDADLSLKGKQLLGSKLSIANPEIHAGLSRGVLKAPVSAGVGGGSLKGEVVLDGSGKTAKLAIDLSGDNLGLGKMMEESGSADLLSGAVAKAEIKLKGQGQSVAALMGSLSGHVLLDVGEGRINNKDINLAGADLVTQLFTALNPVAKQDQFTQLQCAVVNLPFRKGVAEYDKSVAVETDKMTIVSAGRIDMAKETLDIGMAPKPRKDSADLGVGAGDLVSAARLQGTFANPQLGLDAANTAKAGAKVYGAIATGGASLLLGGLVEKFTADPHPCQTARGAKSDSGSTDGESAKPAEKKSGLKSLFGF